MSLGGVREPSAVVIIYLIWTSKDEVLIIHDPERFPWRTLNRLDGAIGHPPIDRSRRHPVGRRNLPNGCETSWCGHITNNSRVSYVAPPCCRTIQRDRPMIAATIGSIRSVARDLSGFMFPAGSIATARLSAAQLNTG